MKKIITLLCTLVLIVSCIKESYDIPRDANGNVILQGISSTTTTGISTLDNTFSVTATLATAKSGDVMKVELLNLQTPQGSTSSQLLPMDGTQKTVTIGSDLKAIVSYNRDEAKLTKAGDYVMVTFAGATDAAIQRVDMVSATTVKNPQIFGKQIIVARTPETAYFEVTVSPKAAAYTGVLIVKRKNGKNDSWVDVPGSPFSGAQPFSVPVSGSDFTIGKDTMYYTFSSALDSYTDLISSTIVVIDPYFYLKKSGTMILGGSNAGVNLFNNKTLSATSTDAIIAIDAGSLIMHGGSAWAVGGKSISFVPSTIDMYQKNNSNDAINAFLAGSPTAIADPATGQGVYIFKLINGPGPNDIYYGMIKIVSLIPNVSITYEYRIGNLYAHLAVIS